MPTLCIVDMQPRFDACQRPWMIRNVRREIRSAKYRRDAIILMEFAGYGPTDKRILEALRWYRKKLRIIKYQCSGSVKILQALEDKGWDTDLRIVGVNTDECVARTINDLHDSKKVTQTLVADACNTYSGYGRGGSYTGRSAVNRKVRRENRRRK